MGMAAIPTSRWAGRQLAELASVTSSSQIAEIDATTLLGERAVLNGFRIPSLRSAGGGCRLFPARDGWIALNLARPDDRDMLPALFEDGGLDPADDEAIASRIALACEGELVARGRELGLALAGVAEKASGPPCAVATTGLQRAAPKHDAPLVVDLSALWAGPLAGHLLWSAGARLVKVESATRPDAMREGDPQLFARLNQGKASVRLDLRASADRAALIALIRRADMVIEAARPRALEQLGIFADALVRETPGLIWLTITGHGADPGGPRNWVGFGDDCGVAGGLSAAMLAATGQPSFVGDAIADPLTGIMAAQSGWKHWREGIARRIIFSMSGIAQQALRETMADGATAFAQQLRAWRSAEGQAFPAVRSRAVADVRPLGADNAAWLQDCPC